MGPRAVLFLAVLLTALLGALPGRAQRATEQYIPMGRSPGLSGVQTLLGRIAALNAEWRSLTVAGAQGPREIAVSDATTIWLDRTALGLTSAPGTIDDCRPQRDVEVKLGEDGLVAEWIKIRIPSEP